jgi:hypothetical protein
MYPDVPLITKHEATCILWTFDHFYKLGVFDAQDERDEYLCSEHANKTLVPGTFGRVRDYKPVGGSEWILAIAYELRGTHVLQTIRRFMDRITRSNFYWCFLPIVQDFYNKGMKDFYENPRYNEIETFMSQPYLHWGKIYKKYTRDEMIEDMQSFCFSRTDSDKENVNNSSKTASRYNLFQKTVYFAYKGNKRWIENLK